MEIRKISDLESLSETDGSENLIAEKNGSAVRIPLSSFGSGGSFIIDLTSIGCSDGISALGDQIIENVKNGMLPIMYDLTGYSPAVCICVDVRCTATKRILIYYYSNLCGELQLSSHPFVVSSYDNFGQ